MKGGQGGSAIGVVQLGVWWRIFRVHLCLHCLGLPMWAIQSIMLWVELMGGVILVQRRSLEGFRSLYWSEHLYGDYVRYTYAQK